jgi:hypothetical protein
VEVVSGYLLGRLTVLGIRAELQRIGVDKDNCIIPPWGTNRCNYDAYTRIFPLASYEYVIVVRKDHLVIQPGPFWFSVFD